MAAIEKTMVSSNTSTLTVHPNNYWSQKPNALMSTLGSSANGLNQLEAERRLTEVGHNVLITKSQVTSLGLFLNQFKSPIMLILIFATFGGIYQTTVLPLAHAASS